MGKKLMLAVALVALMAAPAFASVQNVKVGGDLKTTSVIRSNFDPSATPVLFGGDSAQNVVLSQIGLNVQADLTDNVSTMLRVTNERLWGTTPQSGSDTTTGIKLDTAYVTMKELLYSPLTVTVGRQPLAYGNQFLIGDGDLTTDVSAVPDLTGGVNFDAVKAVLGYDAVTVDLFAAKVSEGTALTTEDNDDADLYGINAAFKVGDKMNTVVEAYTFAKLDKTSIEAGAGNNTKTQKLYVPGLRVSTNPIEGLKVSLEGAYQVGSKYASAGTGVTQTIHAYGLQGKVDYALPVMKDMKPVLSLGYTYLSGDKDTTDDKVKSFNSLYENQNTGRIFDSLGISSSNVKIAEAAFELVPVQDITTKLSVFNLTKAQKTGTPSSVKLGNEVDLDVTYAYTEDVKFGVSAGMFYPNKAYDTDTQKNASQVLSSVSVMF